MLITLTRDADADIEGIFQYTISRFCTEQAKKYYLGLRERFEAIAEGDAYSSDYGFVREGLRRTNFERHAIYYYVIDDHEIRIMRVLHQQMDSIKHLND